MKQIAIVNETKTNGVIILATDYQQHQTYTWYQTDTQGTDGEPMPNENGEALTISIRQIKDMHLNGRYVYCRCVNTVTNEVHRTPYIQLHDDMKRMCNQPNMTLMDIDDVYRA